MALCLQKIGKMKIKTTKNTTYHEMLLSECMRKMLCEIQTHSIYINPWPGNYVGTDLFQTMIWSYRTASSNKLIGKIANFKRSKAISSTSMCLLNILL